MRLSSVYTGVDYSRYDAALVLSITALTAIITSYTLLTGFREVDVYVFQEYASSILHGYVPYRDFTVEFPPCALIFYVIPGLVSLGDPGYFYSYAIETSVFVVLTFVLSLKMLGKVADDRAKIVFSVFFGVFLCIYLTNLVWKFDIFPVFFTCLGVYLFLHGNCRIAYLAVVFASLIKFYPAIVLLFFLACDLCRRDREGNRSALEGVAVSAVALVAAMAPFLIAGVSAGDLASMFAFHSERGFQIESTVGVAVQFLSDLGIGDYEVVPNHGTFDVVSPVTDMLSPIWHYVTAAAVISILAYIFFLFRERGLPADRAERMWFMSAAVSLLLLTFMLTNKVFSTQYLAWIVPWVFFIGISRCHGRMAVIGPLFIVAEILSVFRFDEFPALFHAMFVIRALVLVAMVWMTASAMYGDGCRGNPCTASTGD
ncbi:MAG: DUF2029 domain-containing protein [Candidatus Methanomethylophilaceae archaeon]|nr:DUF2029 domain-containing protein [Candidatus Methanomethylophilaceae archaeon]